MIIKYEIACREAGLSEEQTAEIRKFFDAEKKKLNRRRETRRENGVYYLSIEGMQERAEYDEQDTYDIPDLNTDVEEMAMHTWELGRLNQLLDELSKDDKEFLLACFAEERGSECELARRMGVSRDAVRWRKEKLVKMLKEKFL
ncbi:MAG: sigma-70 family RNA polymerase sigma factor [Lachnospiraceae bacterium]|nr:sigma-70 family RNA polymerase sigma factor [Lachnospiraceae bacterium]